MSVLFAAGIGPSTVVHLGPSTALRGSHALAATPSREVITAVGLAAVAVLIALSAFFASAEIAIFSLGDHRIGTLVAEGVTGAETLSRLKSDPSRLLVTILVGNNVANIGMSSIATGLLGQYLAPGESVLVATFGVTSVVLLFGESAPKSYAVGHSEAWALRVARPLRAAQWLMYPLVATFDALTRLVNRAIGDPEDLGAAGVTRAEVLELVRAGRRAGVFTDEEHRMLQRLLRFRNRIVKEAMVPRLDVVAVEADASLAEAIEVCLDGEYTLVPVYDDVLDDVVGVVHARDLLRARHREQAATPRSLATDVPVVPETKEIDDLLTELRADRVRMAVVVDEFGTTAGIVTIEDIVEEIIGEVLGERERPPIRWIDDGDDGGGDDGVDGGSDDPGESGHREVDAEPRIPGTDDRSAADDGAVDGDTENDGDGGRDGDEERAGDVAIVRGELNVHALNQALGTDLPEGGEYETVAGLVIDGLGRLAEEGDAVSYDGVRLVAETTENSRLLEVRVELPPATRG